MGSSITIPILGEGFRTLNEGGAVEFDVEQGAKDHRPYVPGGRMKCRSRRPPAPRELSQDLVDVQSIATVVSELGSAARLPKLRSDRLRENGGN